MVSLFAVLFSAVTVETFEAVDDVVVVCCGGSVGERLEEGFSDFPLESADLCCCCGPLFCVESSSLESVSEFDLPSALTGLMVLVVIVVGGNGVVSMTPSFKLGARLWVVIFMRLSATGTVSIDDGDELLF